MVVATDADAVNDDRLKEILQKVLGLCDECWLNPVASILIGARKLIDTHWLSVRVRDDGSSYCRYYVSNSEEGGIPQATIFIPKKMGSLKDCNRISFGVIGCLCEILLYLRLDNSDYEKLSPHKLSAFKFAVANALVTERGFVASRAHHTLLGLQWMCENMIQERNRFLSGKIKSLLGDYILVGGR